MAQETLWGSGGGNDTLTADSCQIPGQADLGLPLCYLPTDGLQYPEPTNDPIIPKDDTLCVGPDCKPQPFCPQTQDNFIDQWLPQQVNIQIGQQLSDIQDYINNLMQSLQLNILQQLKDPTSLITSLQQSITDEINNEISTVQNYLQNLQQNIQTNLLTSLGPIVSTLNDLTNNDQTITNNLNQILTNVDSHNQELTNISNDISNVDKSVTTIDQNISNLTEDINNVVNSISGPTNVTCPEPQISIVNQVPPCPSVQTQPTVVNVTVNVDPNKSGSSTVVTNNNVVNETTDSHDVEDVSNTTSSNTSNVNDNNTNISDVSSSSVNTQTNTNNYISTVDNKETINNPSGLPVDSKGCPIPDTLAECKELAESQYALNRCLYQDVEKWMVNLFPSTWAGMVSASVPDEVDSKTINRLAEDKPQGDYYGGSSGSGGSSDSTG